MEEPSAIPTPANVSTANITNTSFELRWDAVAGATSYNVIVATDSNLSNIVGTYSPKTGITATSETINSLSSRSIYHYGVAAVTASGTSDYAKGTAQTTGTGEGNAALNINSGGTGTAIIGVHDATDLTTLGSPYHQSGFNPVIINDGNTSSAIPTWNSNGSQSHSYVGITWTARRTDFIRKFVLTLNDFGDGGWFGSDQSNTVTPIAPLLQVTTDGGTSWTTVNQTNDYLSQITEAKRSNGNAFPPVTFSLVVPATGIDGIRVIGKEGGTASSGFIGVREVEVLAEDVITPSSEPYLTYIIAGQSNAQGYGQSSLLPTLAPNIATETANIEIFITNDEDHADYSAFTSALNLSLNWETLISSGSEAQYTKGTNSSCPINNGVVGGARTNVEPYTFGPELGIARTLKTLNPGKKIRIIKFSKGGSAYSQWDPADAGVNLYDKLIDVVNRANTIASANGQTLEFKGLFWLQGESDATNTLAPNYGANMSAFINSLRTDLSVSATEFKVVLSEIKDSQVTGPGTWFHNDPYTPDGLYENEAEINNQINNNITSTNTAAISTSDMTFRGDVSGQHGATANGEFAGVDGFHYNSADYLVLGDRMATEMSLTDGKSLINPGFELAPNVATGSFDQNSAITGWTVTKVNAFDVAIAGKEFTETTYGSAGIEGEQCAWLTSISGSNTASLSQVTNKTFTAKKIYNFSVDLAASNNTDADSTVTIEILDEQNQVLATKDTTLTSGGTDFATLKVSYNATGSEDSKVKVAISTSYHGAGVVFVDNAKLEIENDISTPAVGLEVSLTDTELVWTVEDEIGVKEYQVFVDGKLFDTVMADGLDFYTVDVPAGAVVKLVVVDEFGFSDTFIPKDGSVVIEVYDLAEGWNLIAITSDDADLETLKDETVGVLWGWSGTSYEVTETAEATDAVWVYSPVAKQVYISGTKSNAKITLSAGWNMVGPVENNYIPADADTVYSWSKVYDVIAGEDKVLTWW